MAREVHFCEVCWSKHSNMKHSGRKMFSTFASIYTCEQTFSLRKRKKPVSGDG
jgi:hypothetical protein